MKLTIDFEKKTISAEHMSVDDLDYFLKNGLKNREEYTIKRFISSDLNFLSGLDLSGFGNKTFFDSSVHSGDEYYDFFNGNSKKTEKPPLGTLPKYIWQKERLQDIKDAIKRYEDAKKPIPAEWVRELLEILHPKKI